MPSASRTAVWQALGTTAVLRLTQPAALAQARALVESELAAIDRTCSRFRPDSDLCRVNSARGRAVTVDPLLIEALEVALGAARATDGCIDPTIGAALKLAGYDRDWSLLERSDSLDAHERSDAGSASTVVRAALQTGWQQMEVDPGRSLVRVPPGVELDLGATAKAWAADRAAHAVHEAMGTGVLVGLGGDIATAGTAPVDGWRIYVSDDHRASPSGPGQTIAIHDGGLATSSTTVRRWIKDGAEMHHIIDPATGAPSQGCWRTVSVAAANCSDANVASTAAILRSRQAPAWLAKLGLPARLVALDGAVTRVGGWPAEQASVAA